MKRLELIGVRAERAEKTVLDGMDATFHGGRLTVVIGPNGAGKSTLLDVAAGLLNPASGRVELDGADIGTLSLRQLAQRRAYLPQSPRVDWAISVERVVALGITARLPAFGGLPEAWKPKIDLALQRLNLLHLRERPATRLSGGELARVMLARATVADPEILIVDEPTAGLDPRHALDAGERLRALARAGCGVVVALHDLDLAARIADDVIAIKDGRIVAQGRADDILNEAVLREVYDVRARVSRDTDGLSIRFLP